MTDPTTSADDGAPTGSWFPVPNQGALPADLQELFGEARKVLGFVPNVFRAQAFRPTRLTSWFSHYRQLHEPTDGLDAADREMIAVVVSSANGCLYCLVVHCAALREELGDAVLGEWISYDWRRAGLDTRRTAICAYAEKLTMTPRLVTRDDLQSLLDVGLSIEEAWDVAELSAMYNLTNRMAMATNILPNAEYSAQARRSRPPSRSGQAAGGARSTAADRRSRKGNDRRGADHDA